MGSSLPDSVTPKLVETDYLITNTLVSGDPDGTPVCLIHGNATTSRF